MANYESIGSGNPSYNPEQAVQHEGVDQRDFGLCFSGGGMRSASFHAGVLEALADKRLLHKADYLSCVSGGGYVGSAYCAELAQIANANSVTKDQARIAIHNVISRMRQHPNPMFGRLNKLADFVRRAVSAFFFQFFFLVSLAFTCSNVVALLCTEDAWCSLSPDGYGCELPNTYFITVCPNLSSAGTDGAVYLFRMTIVFTLLLLLGVLAVSLLVTILFPLYQWCRSCCSNSPTNSRENAAGSLPTLQAAVAQPTGPQAAAAQPTQPTPNEEPDGWFWFFEALKRTIIFLWLVVFSWDLVLAITLLLAQLEFGSRANDESDTKGIGAISVLLAGGLGSTLLGLTRYLPTLLVQATPSVRNRVLVVVLALVAVVLGSALFAWIATWRIFGIILIRLDDPWYFYITYCIVGALGLLFAFAMHFDAPNELIHRNYAASIATFYRNSKCAIGQLPQKPYYIANATAFYINDKSMIHFIMGPRVYGSDLTGYYNTPQSLQLSTCAAMSGAAIASEMGDNHNFGFGARVLINLLGLSWGKWVHFPGSHVGERVAIGIIGMLGPTAMYLGGIFIGKDVLTRDNVFPLGDVLLFAGLAWFVLWSVLWLWLGYGMYSPFGRVLRQVFRSPSKGNTEVVYVADGGHYENLGLFQLVRRGVKVILCTDAEDDPERRFNALASALWQCYEQLGASFTFPGDTAQSARMLSLERMRKSLLKQSEHSHLVIRYKVRTYDPATNSQTEREGTIFYIKSTVTDAVSSNLHLFTLNQPEFSHHPTAVQFVYTRELFEHYRLLGKELTEKAVQDVKQALRGVGDSHGGGNSDDSSEDEGNAGTDTAVIPTAADVELNPL